MTPAEKRAAYARRKGHLVVAPVPAPVQEPEPEPELKTLPAPYPDRPWTPTTTPSFMSRLRRYKRRALELHGWIVRS